MIFSNKNRLLKCTVLCLVSSVVLFSTARKNVFANGKKVAADAKQPGRQPEKGRVGPSVGKAKPVFSRRLLVLDLAYVKGRVHTSGVGTEVHPKRIRIPRYEARFEARIYRNKKLVESLRFDFPLLGEAETFTRTGDRIWRRFERGIQSRVKLRLPWDNPADRVEIFDLKRKRAVNVDLSLLKKHGMTLVPRRSVERPQTKGSKSSRSGRDSKNSGSGGKE